MPVDLLLVDASADAARYASMLRGSYRVALGATTAGAREFLHRQPPAMVIADLDDARIDAIDICREAKSLVVFPLVLVTTEESARVPDALAAGCDGVLLKPYAPNLLCARVGRLLRARASQLRARAQHQASKARHLADRSDELLAGTNRVWPNTHCPYCNHGGVTSFEFCSHRRSWYACLECKKVWIAKRQE